MSTPTGQGIFIVTSTSQISNPVNGNTWAYIAGPPPTLYVYNNNIWNVVAGTNAPYIVGGTIIGHPAAGGVIIRIKFSIAVTFPSGLTDSTFIAGTAANGSSVFTINKNGGSIGTMTFAGSATAATFSFSAQVSFAINDIMTIVAPNPQDSTLADLGLSLLGTRN